MSVIDRSESRFAKLMQLRQFARYAIGWSRVDRGSNVKEHVCTKKCLRWSVSFGRRWYYCALTKPVVVRVERFKPG